MRTTWLLVVLAYTLPCHTGFFLKLNFPLFRKEKFQEKPLGQGGGGGGGGYWGRGVPTQQVSLL